MTEIRGNLRESADGLRGRRSDAARMREQEQAVSDAQRRLKEEVTERAAEQESNDAD